MKRNIRFDIQDFALSIKEQYDLGNKRGIDDELNSPLHKLYYMQFSSFSKEEILSHNKMEKKGNFWDRNDTIFKKVMRTKSALLFSVFIENNICRNEFSEYSNFWIDAVGVDKVNNNMIEAIHMCESSIMARQNAEESFFYSFFSYFKKNSNSDYSKEDVIAIKAFINSNHKDVFKKHFLELLYNSATKEDFCQLVLSLFKESGDDLTKEPVLHRFLPKDYPSNKSSRFFISSGDNDNMKSLVNLGFKIDQSNYEYNGMSLVTALLDSKREDLISIIVPALKDLNTKPYLLDAQKKAIDEYGGDPKNKEMLAFLMFKELDAKIENKDKDKKRLKI